MKYLKYFEQASDYEAYKNGSDYVLPNVSFVENSNVVMYTPGDIIIMTSESNPRAMEVCYNQGWAASPDVMYKSEAEKVTDIGTAFSDGYFESGEWSNPEMLELKSFDEFQYFVNVKTLSPMAFNAVSNMETIVLPPNLITIGDNAFQYCYKLKNIVIPDSVTTIGDSAFYMYDYGYESSLSSITLGSGVATIGNSAFYGCSSLTSITIPDSVTSISSGAFEDCSGLTSIVIPNSVTSIGYGAFHGCSSLTSITIPDSVTSISSGAFEDCSGLTSIVIPNSVTSIGNFAFHSCSNLNDITCLATTAPSIHNYTFMNITSDGVLKVPTGSDYSTWMSTGYSYLGYYRWTIEYIQ